MESSFDARIRAAVERTLPQAPLEVYQALARADQYRAWWPGSIGFTTIDGPLGVGSRIEVRAFGSPSTMEVVRVQPGQGIWFRFLGGAYKGTSEWLLEQAEGGTRVVYQLRAEPTGKWLDFLCRFIDLGKVHAIWAAKALENLESRLSRA